MRDQVIISKGIDWITVWFYIIFVFIGLLCIFSVEYHHSENILENISSNIETPVNIKTKIDNFIK